MNSVDWKQYVPGFAQPYIPQNIPGNKKNYVSQLKEESSEGSNSKKGTYYKEKIESDITVNGIATIIESEIAGDAIVRGLCYAQQSKFGSLRVEGILNAQKLNVSRTFEIDGPCYIDTLNADKIVVNGAFHGANIQAKHLNIRGLSRLERSTIDRVICVSDNVFSTVQVNHITVHRNNKENSSTIYLEGKSVVKNITFLVKMKII